MIGMRTVLVIAATSGGMLSGCAIIQRAIPALTMSDANIVEVLNQIGKDEIEAGELARQKGATAEVQAFAGRVVNEHRGFVEKNLRLAQKMDLQLTPPYLASSLKQAHEKAMEKLRKKSGPDFDRAYIQYEIAMHVQAVNLVEAAAAESANSSLKQHLLQAGPDFLSHLSAARAVERDLVAQR